MQKSLKVAGHSHEIWPAFCCSDRQKSLLVRLANSRGVCDFVSSGFLLDALLASLSHWLASHCDRHDCPALASRHSTTQLGDIESDELPGLSSMRLAELLQLMLAGRRLADQRVDGKGWLLIRSCIFLFQGFYYFNRTK
ncbi:unnamed protein product [Protopolystoma xenopodis]|uniref:Uncharacterized protein n=1 Tax=Protopolystoma xenopodis TaxID=117903 RepID=A0A3S5AYB1_9PLAT|nr:unnamed protein product [Protopolystoma xenopodis]